MPDKKVTKEALFITRAKKKLERLNKRHKSNFKEKMRKLVGAKA